MVKKVIKNKEKNEPKIFKICVVGDDGIGKEKFVELFALKKIDKVDIIGANFYLETIIINTLKGPKECIIQIWVFGGKERFGFLHNKYWLGAKGILLFFDLANRESFLHLIDYIDEIKKNAKTTIPILLVGNKSDFHTYAISPKELNNMIRKYNLYYIETSLITKEGIYDCFYCITSLMLGVDIRNEYFLSKDVIYHPNITPVLSKRSSPPFTPKDLSNLSQMAIFQKKLDIIEEKLNHMETTKKEALVIDDHEKVDKLFYERPDFINILTEELKKIDYVFIKSLEKSGAWAKIYLVFHELTEENRILKIYKVPLDESSKSALVRQDKKLSQILHENIVKIYQSGFFEFNDQKIRYSILEYLINSKSLDELTPKVFQEKSLETRVDLALTLIKTIKSIRKKGFIHGDLHEGNILITTDNELKIIDPGFSKISDMAVDSDISYIQSLYRNYFFTEKEIKMDKVNKLMIKDKIDEIPEILKQLKESFPKKRLEKGIKKKYELVYKDLLEDSSKSEKSKCRVGIAQIGVSKVGDIVTEFYEKNDLGLLGLREDKFELIRSKVEDMIEEAYKKRVNILLFPELIIDLNYSQLIKEIKEYAKKYEIYIIPGSYHDKKTMRNISIIFGPDGILWEQEKHIPATIHLDGERFKERIEVSALPRKTFVCNTEFGRIAVVICRDFLDMDLRVELKNFEPPVDIILNTAFTPVTADFKSIHFDARRSIYAYCFFANVAEYGDSIIYTPEKERVERRIPPKEENLIYKDVDLFKLRSERKKWEKEYKKERPFIQSTR